MVRNRFHLRASSARSIFRNNSAITQNETVTIFLNYMGDFRDMTTAFDKKNQITEGVIWRQLLIFFFPILIGTFFQQLYNTVDTVIVGQFVGKEALASVGGSSAQIVALVVGFLPVFPPALPSQSLSFLEQKMPEIQITGCITLTPLPLQAEFCSL